MYTTYNRLRKPLLLLLAVLIVIFTISVMFHQQFDDLTLLQETPRLMGSFEHDHVLLARLQNKTSHEMILHAIVLFLFIVYGQNLSAASLLRKRDQLSMMLSFNAIWLYKNLIIIFNTGCYKSLSSVDLHNL